MIGRFIIILFLFVFNCQGQEIIDADKFKKSDGIVIIELLGYP